MFAKDCLLSCNSVYAKLRNIKFKFKVQVEPVRICSLFSFLTAAAWFTSNGIREAAIKKGFARNVFIGLVLIENGTLIFFLGSYLLRLF